MSKRQKQSQTRAPSSSSGPASGAALVTPNWITTPWSPGLSPGTANGTVQAKQGSSSAVIQRYPVGLSNTNEILRTSGRPNAKSNKSTVQAIIARIWAVGPKNDYENALKNLGSQTKAVTAIVSGKWLSTNDAAICHKLAIDVIEYRVVAYANAVVSGTASSSLHTEMENWVKDLTQGYGTVQGDALMYLNAIKNAPSSAGLFGNAAATAQGHCDSLILTLDGSPANLFIGSAQTNSSVQSYFDGHYDVMDPTDTNPVTATPISRSIYDSDHLLAPSLGLQPSSPRRATDKTGDWVETSSVPGIGWVVIDKKNNPI